MKLIKMKLQIISCLSLLIAALACTHLGASLNKAESSDPNQWLEDVNSEDALKWVGELNQKTLGHYQATSQYDSFYNASLEVLQSKEKIPMVKMRGQYLYNFWQDEKSVRGIIRRTSLRSYLRAKPIWETVLDLDLLAQKENKNWVYKGLTCAPEENPCLLLLSDGGKDALVAREFDLKSKRFVSARNKAFYIPEAKSQLAFLDQDTLLVASDFGPGSLTDSGYPRLLKKLKRGQKLEQAETLFEIPKESMIIAPFSDQTQDSDGSWHTYAIVSHSKSFFKSDLNLYWKGKFYPIQLPETVEVYGVFKSQLIFETKQEHAQDKLKAGTLLSLDLSWITQPSTLDRRPELTEHPLLSKANKIFEPSSKSFLQKVEITKEGILYTILNDVTGQLWWAKHNPDQSWETKLLSTPQGGSISELSTGPKESRFFFLYEDFLTADSYYLGDLAAQNAPTETKKIKQLPEFFDASNLVATQKFATSKDGTKVPYFIIHRKDLAYNSNNPTLLYGYGGFRISLEPSYSGVLGRLWLDQGGVYVLANIRGGGEYGPLWHEAALKTNRHKAYQDFEAVALDIIDKKVTSPSKLGIMGGSNGGLLMGVNYTQHPELFQAVVCQVPLLDMLRYHKLLAGASWMGEYGNPEDPIEGAYLKSYSPYQNIDPNKKHPPILFITSTKDDRVHPGHARKMAAKLSELGFDFEYYENIDGGHAGAANLKEHAKKSALTYSFLWEKLGK